MIRWACGAYKERYTKQSCFFWLRYAPNRLSTGALPQTPLGELTALPRPPNWFRGWGRPGKGNEGGEGEGRERKGGERERERERKEGEEKGLDERGSWTPRDFQMD